MERLPISVQICTLNEGGNIEECIRCVRESIPPPTEVLVIDGGSNDDTAAKASALGARVLQSERGLSRQRQAGIESTSFPYVALVDADDRISRNFLSTLLQELQENHLDAIGVFVEPQELETYWQCGWGLYASKPHLKVTPSNMVGRPALFKREPMLALGFDPFFDYGSEDTDQGYRFEKAGYRQAIGTGIDHRIHPRTFNQCRKKWIRYGWGYARFAWRHPERRRNIVLHVALHIPFIHMWHKTIETRRLRYAPFFLLYGLFCTIGYGTETIRLHYART
jgi:glycosyltransferase involved in cell wall biosynthesis